MDETDLLLALDKRAENLSALTGDRLDRELDKIRDRAAAAFQANGEDDLSAWLRADEMTQRLLVLVARHKQRREAHEAARREDWERRGPG